MAIKIPVNIKKLYEDAVVPSYETEQAAGFDLRAYLAAPTGLISLPPAKVERVVPKEQGFKRFSQAIKEVFTGVELKAVPSRTLVKTGVAVAVPEGFELQVRSRSGLALKQGAQVHVGTVDADYRGEVGVILFNFGSDHFIINHGDRIAQGVINEIKQAGFNVVDDLDETQRGTGGFGSTGVSTALLNANKITADSFIVPKVSAKEPVLNIEQQREVLDLTTQGVRL